MQQRVWVRPRINGVNSRADSFQLKSSDSLKDVLALTLMSTVHENNKHSAFDKVNISILVFIDPGMGYSDKPKLTTDCITFLD